VPPADPVVYLPSGKVSYMTAKGRRVVDKAVEAARKLLDDAGARALDAAYQKVDPNRNAQYNTFLLNVPIKSVGQRGTPSYGFQYAVKFTGGAYKDHPTFAALKTAMLSAVEEERRTGALRAEAEQLKAKLQVLFDKYPDKELFMMHVGEIVPAGD